VAGGVTSLRLESPTIDCLFHQQMLAAGCDADVQNRPVVIKIA
jgi:hypothetical protein